MKAEVEWPKFDGTDPYYDVEEYFKDLKRVMMLASGGKGYPPHERMEMLRGGLSGVPLLDFKTFVDDSELRSLTLERGTNVAREALWEEVEAYLKRSFHRPLLERQCRARAGYNGCSMWDGVINECMTFQTDIKRRLKKSFLGRLAPCGQTASKGRWLPYHVQPFGRMWDGRFSIPMRCLEQGLPRVDH